MRGQDHEPYICFRVVRDGTMADGMDIDHDRAYSLESRDLHVMPALVSFPGTCSRLTMDGNVPRINTIVPPVQTENM